MSDPLVRTPHEQTHESFYRALGGFTIRAGRPDDIQTIKTRWRQYFVGFDDPDEELDLVDAACDPEHEYSDSNYAYVAEVQDDVVGVSLASRASPGWMAEAIGYDPIGEYFAEENGYLAFSAVDPGWRNRGIGSALFLRRMEVLAQDGAGRLFGISWRRDDAPDSSTLFEKFGFQVIAQVEDYYGDPDHRGYCPDCGDRSTCSATIYGRTV